MKIGANTTCVNCSVIDADGYTCKVEVNSYCVTSTITSNYCTCESSDLQYDVQLKYCVCIVGDLYDPATKKCKKCSDFPYCSACTLAGCTKCIND